MKEKEQALTQEIDELIKKRVTVTKKKIKLIKTRQAMKSPKI